MDDIYDDASDFRQMCMSDRQDHWSKAADTRQAYDSHKYRSTVYDILGGHVERKTKKQADMEQYYGYLEKLFDDKVKKSDAILEVNKIQMTRPPVKQSIKQERHYETDPKHDAYLRRNSQTYKLRRTIDDHAYEQRIVTDVSPIDRTSKMVISNAANSKIGHKSDVYAINNAKASKVKDRTVIKLKTDTGKPAKPKASIANNIDIKKTNNDKSNKTERINTDRSTPMTHKRTKTAAMTSATDTSKTAIDNVIYRPQTTRSINDDKKQAAIDRRARLATLKATSDKLRDLIDAKKATTDTKISDDDKVRQQVIDTQPADKPHIQIQPFDTTPKKVDRRQSSRPSVTSITPASPTKQLVRDSNDIKRRLSSIRPADGRHLEGNDEIIRDRDGHGKAVVSTSHDVQVKHELGETVTVVTKITTSVIKEDCEPVEYHVGGSEAPPVSPVLKKNDDIKMTGAEIKAKEDGIFGKLDFMFGKTPTPQPNFEIVPSELKVNINPAERPLVEEACPETATIATVFINSLPAVSTNPVITSLNALAMTPCHTYTGLSAGMIDTIHPGIDEPCRPETFDCNELWNAMHDQMNDN